MKNETFKIQDQRSGRMSHVGLPPLATYDAPRPRRLDGAAVAGVAAGLGRRARGPVTRQRAAGAAGRALLRQRLSQQGVVGQGRGQDRWSSGKVLAPLADFREKLLFIRGLYNDEALKGNIHSSQTGNLLSGAPLASGGEIRSGTSIDQVLAQRHGQSTKVPSLVLGCEKSNPSVHKNYSMLYSSHISWSSPTTPTPLELYPALAFDRLFKDEVQAGRQERARRRARRRQGLPPADQHHRPAQARRVSRLGARGRAADRAGRQEGRAARLAADARQAEHPPPGRRHSAGHRRAHAADVRHPGAGLPDRHHAGLHAQAEQRPLARCGSRTWASTT